MNDITQSAARSFNPSRFGFPNDFWLRSLDLFLYRDSLPRPDSEFAWPRRDHPDWPFSLLSTECTEITFRLFADRPSLQRSLPLRFYSLVIGICIAPLAGAQFRAFGGGQALGPEHDSATIHSLHQALRSFPAGWAYATVLNNTPSAFGDLPASLRSTA